MALASNLKILEASAFITTSDIFSFLWQICLVIFPPRVPDSHWFPFLSIHYENQLAELWILHELHNKS